MGIIISTSNRLNFQYLHLYITDEVKDTLNIMETMNNSILTQS